MGTQMKPCSAGSCVRRCVPGVGYCTEHWRECTPALLASATKYMRMRRHAGRGLWEMHNPVPVDKYVTTRDGIEDAVGWMQTRFSTRSYIMDNKIANKPVVKVESTTKTAYELKLDGKQIIALLNGQLTMDCPVPANAIVQFTVPGGEYSGMQVDVDKSYPVSVCWTEEVRS